LKVRTALEGTVTTENGLVPVTATHRGRAETHLPQLVRNAIEIAMVVNVREIVTTCVDETAKGKPTATILAAGVTTVSVRSGLHLVVKGRRIKIGQQRMVMNQLGTPNELVNATSGMAMSVMAAPSVQVGVIDEEGVKTTKTKKIEEIANASEKRNLHGWKHMFHHPHLRVSLVGRPQTARWMAFKLGRRV
jgi:hypothetical protein